MLDLGSAADMFVGLDPHGGPAVARDFGSAADMFVGLDPHGGPAVSLDLSSAADMFVGRDLGVPDMFVGPTAPRPRQRAGHVRRSHGPAVARPRQRGGHVRRPQGTDIFVGLDPAVTLDLGSAADTFVGPEVARGGHVRRPYGPRWRATSAAQRTCSSAPRAASCAICSRV